VKPLKQCAIEASLRQHKPMESPIPYHVQISNVRELSLFGAADLDLWQKYLHPYALHPSNINGQAEILISAIAAKFKGLTFRELSICISVNREENSPDSDGFFLIQAFNSRRFFAFVERAMFRTPYHHGYLDVTPDPAHMRLSKRKSCLLNAEMSSKTSTTRSPPPVEDFLWEGPIFLPHKATTIQTQRLFYARLIGPRQSFAFLASQDVCSLAPSAEHPVFRSLLDSNFAAKLWMTGDNSTHAKSRTISQESLGFSSATFAHSD
jgi:hypothetical protein